MSTPLTPAELDQDDRRTRSSYFETRDEDTRGRKAQSPKSEHVLAARTLFEKRRRAERIRRVSEGALLGVIGLVVLAGPSVWGHLSQWHRGEPSAIIFTFVRNAITHAQQ